MAATPDEILLEAVEKKDAKAATAALDAGANPSAVTATFKPALHIAIEKKSKTLVKLLITRGADVNAVDRKGNSALYVMADVFPDVALGELLLAKGADPNVRGKENAPLHRAIKRPTLAFAEMLVTHGAAIDLPNHEGSTPLHLVIAGGSGDMTDTDVVAMKWLVDRGASVHTVDDDGRTPLLVASRNGHNRDTFTALFERGAKLVADKYGNTALHYAVGQTSCTHAWLWQLLLDKGCKIDARDERGQTALHEATTCWNDTAVRFLLAKGADTTIADTDGRTAYACAKHYNQAKNIAAFEDHANGVTAPPKKQPRKKAP